MRILLQTPPVPGVTGRRPDGTLERGSAFFVARVYDAGEQVPRNHNARTVREWQRDGFGDVDGAMRVPAPEFLVPPIGTSIPDAIVPARLLRALPEDARLTLEWNVVRGGTT